MVDDGTLVDNIIQIMTINELWFVKCSSCIDPVTITYRGSQQIQTAFEEIFSLCSLHLALLCIIAQEADFSIQKMTLNERSSKV